MYPQEKVRKRTQIRMSLNNKTVNISTSSLHWHCLSGYQNHILTADIHNWLDLDDNPKAELIKSNMVRKIYRVELKEMQVFVKVYTAASLREFLKWHLRPCPAKVEFQNLQTAKLKLLPVPQPLAWACSAKFTRPCAILVIKSLAPCVSLDELLKQETDLLIHKPQANQSQDDKSQNTSAQEAKLPLVASSLSDTLSAAARAIALMHHNAIVHNDLHTGNILLVANSAQIDDTVGMVDTDNTANAASANTHTAPTDATNVVYSAYITDLRHISHVRSYLNRPQLCSPWQLRNLAVISASLKSRVAPELLYNFLKTYLVSLQRHHKWTEQEFAYYWQELMQNMDLYLRDFVIRRDRRAMANTKYSSPVRLTEGYSGYVFLQAKNPITICPASKLTFSREDWLHTLAQPGALPTCENTAVAAANNITASGCVLKQGNQNTVIARLLTIGKYTIQTVIKHSLVPHNLHFLSQTFGQPRAISQWRKAHMLINRKIPTAWPLAALVHRKFGIPTDSLFLCEYIDNGYTLYECMTNPQLLNVLQRRELVDKLAKLLAGIHHWDFYHRDCKPSNVVVQLIPCPQDDNSRLELFLVDLDGIKLCGWYYFFRLFPRMRYARKGGWFYRLYHQTNRHLAITRLARATRGIKGVSSTDKMRVFGNYLRLIDAPQTKSKELRHRLWRKIDRKIERKIVKKTCENIPKNCRKCQKSAENVEKMPEKNGNIDNIGRLGKISLSRYEFRNILIVKPSSLGDIVRTLPFLPVLREKYPKSRISWLVRPIFADLLRDNPYIDEIIEFDRKYFGKIFRNYAATRDFFKFLHQLRKRHFDLVIDAQGLFRSGFIAFATGSPVRLGFARAREMASMFYNYKVNLPGELEHFVDTCWRLMRPLGLYDKPKRFVLPVNDEHQRQAVQLLRKQGIMDDEPYFVILPGGTVAEKRWSAHNFAQLAAKLSAKYHYPVVLLGNGQIEHEIALEIMQLAPNIVSSAKGGIKTDVRTITTNGGAAGIINLVGKTSVQQMIAIIGKAKMVIGNDSGPLHIAAAMGVGLVALYGPTNPCVVGPYGYMGSVIEAGRNVERTGRYSSKEEHNINSITVEQVFEKVEAVLESSL